MVINFNKEERYKEAEKAYRQVLNLDPRDKVAWNNLGLALEEQGRHKEAKEAYQQALNIDPTYQHARDHLQELEKNIQTLKANDAIEWGNVLSEQKPYKEKEIEEYYWEAIRLDPNSKVAYNNLGCLFSKQGRDKEARAAFKKALNIDPTYQHARDNLRNNQGILWFDVLQPLWEKTKQIFVGEDNLEKAVSKEYQVLLKAKFDSMLDNPGKRDQPIDAPIKNNINKRSAGEYHKVIEQFHVENSKRYKPDEYTYCNIFVWDVTRAMCGPKEEMPHWVNGEEMKVNQLVNWLNKEGEKKGWHRVDVRVAYQMANEGHPTVAIWKNPKKRKNTETGKMEEVSGHTAMVRPGNPDDDQGPAIAQAGDAVLDASHLHKHFNDVKLKRTIEFWYHE